MWRGWIIAQQPEGVDARRLSARPPQPESDVQRTMETRFQKAIKRMSRDTLGVIPSTLTGGGHAGKARLDHRQRLAQRLGSIPHSYILLLRKTAMTERLREAADITKADIGKVCSSRLRTGSASREISSSRSRGRQKERKDDKAEGEA